MIPPVVRGPPPFVQGDFRAPRPALLAVLARASTRIRRISRAATQKMRAVLPLDLVMSTNRRYASWTSAVACSVCQGRSPLICQRQPSQLLVHERRQLLDRLRVAFSPRNQEVCDRRRKR